VQRERDGVASLAVQLAALVRIEPEHRIEVVETVDGQALDVLAFAVGQRPSAEDLGRVAEARKLAGRVDDDALDPPPLARNRRLRT
jgi:hypothetical protein